MKGAKNDKKYNYNIITFRVSKSFSKKIDNLLLKIRKRTDTNVTRSEFFRVVFEKGLDKLEKEIAKSDKYFCEKCGKRYAVTVPRHLRKRLDVCECSYD